MTAAVRRAVLAQVAMAAENSGFWSPWPVGDSGFMMPTSMP